MNPPPRWKDMKKMISPVLISIALLILLIPLQARAGLDEAYRDCNNTTDAHRQLSGCTKIINHYLHRFRQIDQAKAYAQRAQAKIKLGYNVNSINPDLKKACDLGEGLSCCALAGWYYRKWMEAWEMELDDDKSREQMEKLVTRAEHLGVDGTQCKKVFGFDGP